MKLTRFSFAHDFRARAEAFLLEHEAEHNLPLGLMASLIFNPDHSEFSRTSQLSKIRARPSRRR